MKKLVSFLLIIISLFSVLALSASAEEITVKGFTFDMPDGFVRDKKYEKEFGVDRYWYNEEKGIEMLFKAGGDSELYLFGEEDGKSYTRRYTYEKMYGAASSHSGREKSSSSYGCEIRATKRLFYDGETDPYIVMYEYYFPVTAYGYNLSFFVNSEKESEFTDSVADSGSFNGYAGIYYTAFEDIFISFLSLIALITVAVTAIKSVKLIKEKKKGKNIS